MMITNSMEPDQESELVSLVEDYANAIRAWDKNKMEGRLVVRSRLDIIDYVGSLLAAKDAEIARLQANQITPEMWALLDQAKAAGREGNGGREFFALRDFLNRLETLRGPKDDA